MDSQEDAQLELTQWIIPILRRNNLGGFSLAIDAEGFAQYQAYRVSFTDFAAFLDNGRISTIHLILSRESKGKKKEIEKVLNGDQYFKMSKMKAVVHADGGTANHNWVAVEAE